MKLFWVPILILLVAVQSFSKWLILLDYQVNQNYIAQNLCENRNKPQMRCKGKCQLKKKLAADENQNQGNEGSTAKVKFAEVLFADPQPLVSITAFLDNAPSLNGHYQFYLYSAPLSAPFHPPAVV